MEGWSRIIPREDAETYNSSKMHLLNIFIKLSKDFLKAKIELLALCCLSELERIVQFLVKNGET